MSTMSFEDWYDKHKQAIHLLKDRKDVAFYVWNNKPTRGILKAPKTSGGYSEDFEAFWKEYPRKEAKHVAYISWNKAKPPIIDIMSALEWQVKQEQWVKDSGKFIPHAATWLNQKRWLDEKPADLKLTKESYVDMNGRTQYR